MTNQDTQAPGSRAHVTLMHPTKRIEVVTSFAAPDLTMIAPRDAVLMVGAAMAKVVRWGGHLRESVTVGLNSLALYGAVRVLDHENDNLHLAALLYGCEAAFGGEIQWGVAKVSAPWRAHQAACHRAVCALTRTPYADVTPHWNRIYGLQAALSTAECVAYGGRVEDPAPRRGNVPYADPAKLRDAYDAALDIGWRATAAWWCQHALTFGENAPEDIGTSWEEAERLYLELGGRDVPGREYLGDLGKLMEDIWTR